MIVGRTALPDPCARLTVRMRHTLDPAPPKPAGELGHLEFLQFPATTKTPISRATPPANRRRLHGPLPPLHIGGVLLSRPSPKTCPPPRSVTSPPYRLHAGGRHHLTDPWASEDHDRPIPCTQANPCRRRCPFRQGRSRVLAEPSPAATPTGPDRNASRTVRPPCSSSTTTSRMRRAHNPTIRTIFTSGYQNGARKPCRSHHHHGEPVSRLTGEPAVPTPFVPLSPGSTPHPHHPNQIFITVQLPAHAEPNSTRTTKTD